MLGVLDSGMGGENTVREIRRVYPRLDILLLKDKENAPYGTKSEGELVRITEQNIDKLTSLGAEKVLIACCTASTVWDKLEARHKERSIPILRPTADEARRVLGTPTVALLATERTVSSRAFEELFPDRRLIGIAAQRLVGIVEMGERDGSVSGACIEYLEEVLAPLSSSGADTLILGCTHFPSLEKTIGKISEKYGIKNTVSSALGGVRALGEVRGISTLGLGVTVRI